ncbi:hypothetical protein CL628_03145 [bacterium]|nr:hypothetical protein [bacterium]
MKRTKIIGSVVAVMMFMALNGTGTAIAEDAPTIAPAPPLPDGVVDVGVKTFTIIGTDVAAQPVNNKKAPELVQKLTTTEGVLLARITGRKLEVRVAPEILGVGVEAAGEFDSDCAVNSGFNEHLAQKTADEKLLRAIVDQIVVAITRTRHPKIPASHLARITRSDGHIDVTLYKAPVPAVNQVGFLR